jgi:hypothetical protein
MKRLLPLIAALVLALSSARTARAQDTHRDATWQTVTTVTAVTALGTQIFMPRVFYAEPETTVGWRARWHLSALAPAMTLTVLTFANEYALKDAIKSQRPGCDDTNQGTGNCQEYGSLSSHAFLATSSFGNGLAVFLVDTYKWSDGRFNAGSFTGNVVLPVLLAAVTDVGRAAGNWESGGQVAVSSLTGLAFGALTGFAFASLARPECGYSGLSLCW